MIVCNSASFSCLIIGSCSMTGQHTGQMDIQVWAVDLGSKHRIHDVLILNKRRCFTWFLSKSRWNYIIFFVWDSHREDAISLLVFLLDITKYGFRVAVSDDLNFQKEYVMGLSECALFEYTSLYFISMIAIYYNNVIVINII